MLPGTSFYSRARLSGLNLRIIALAGRLTQWAYNRSSAGGDNSGLAIMLSILFLTLGQLALTEGFWTQLFFLFVSTSILILAAGLVLALVLVLVGRLCAKATRPHRLFGRLI